MERKEERNKFISDYLKENHRQDSYESFAESEDIARACACAIDWADKTIIDKATEWIGKHYQEYAHNKLGMDYITCDFKKAMEG